MNLWTRILTVFSASALLLTAANGQQPVARELQDLHLNGDLFTDITAASGYHHIGHGKAIALADLNQNGRLDIYMSVCYGRNKFYLNQGEMRFVDITHGTSLDDPTDAHGIAIADFDNDGYLEIFVANNVELASEHRGEIIQPNNFFKSGSEMTFVDRAVAAGVDGGAYNFSAGVTTADVTGNGYLDMFVTKGAYRNGPDCADSLYINNGKGAFVDIAEDVGVASQNNGYTAAFSDYNKNGRPDLVVAGLNTRENSTLALYRNDSRDGEVIFTDVTDEAGLKRLSGYVVSVFWGDVTNNGYPDLFVGTSRDGNIRNDEVHGSNYLYRNNGDGTFTDISEWAGIGRVATNTRGVTMGDVNNNGFLDIYITNSMGFAKLLINDGNGRFTDQIETLGAGVWYGHGASLGDLNNNGSLDLVVGNWRQIAGKTDGIWRMFENNTRNDAWLKINFTGTVSNRSAVMTKAELYQAGHAGDDNYRLGYREVTAGNGTFPGNPLQVHFGLGAHETVDLVATFPSGRQVTKRGVERGQLLNIVEPE